MSCIIPFEPRLPTIAARGRSVSATPRPTRARDAHPGSLGDKMQRLVLTYPPAATEIEKLIDRLLTSFESMPRDESGGGK